MYVRCMPSDRSVPSRRRRGVLPGWQVVDVSGIDDEFAALLDVLRGGHVGGSVLAADERAGYDVIGPVDEGPAPLPTGPDPEPAPDIREAVAGVRAAVVRLRTIVDDRTVSAGGELGGLVELLATLDAAQATAVALTDR